MTDDGRCWHEECRGLYRVLCYHRGQHPPPACAHEETVTREFKLHGIVDTVVTECVACGMTTDFRSPARDNLLATLRKMDNEVVRWGT